MYKKTGGFQCSSKDESANGATEANASWTEEEGKPAADDRRGHIVHICVLMSVNAIPCVGQVGL